MMDRILPFRKILSGLLFVAVLVGLHALLPGKVFASTHAMTNWHTGVQSAECHSHGSMNMPMKHHAAPAHAAHCALQNHTHHHQQHCCQPDCFASGLSALLPYTPAHEAAWQMPAHRLRRNVLFLPDYTADPLLRPPKLHNA
ncbi:hypothetical protein [Acetobacter pasteurianus]|uniref:hypothetical protein n=1 Tax=Acetobacter pasteurianus TaxID=438 RepID=UPI001623593D|nr:hypothetical protein [Acetobacter pasteurianus]